jgi:hypothetical protein
MPERVGGDHRGKLVEPDHLGHEPGVVADVEAGRRGPVLAADAGQSVDRRAHAGFEGCGPARAGRSSAPRPSRPSPWPGWRSRGRGYESSATERPGQAAAQGLNGRRFPSSERFSIYFLIFGYFRLATVTAMHHRLFMVALGKSCLPSSEGTLSYRSTIWTALNVGPRLTSSPSNPGLDTGLSDLTTQK